MQEGLQECYYNYHGSQPAGSEGPDYRDFPCGRCETPVIWQYLGEIIHLKFISGFIGVQQDQETREVTPCVSWCVVNTKSI